MKVMKPITLNTNQERSTLKDLREKYPNSVISPSSIRRAILLESGRGTYTFPVKRDVGAQLAHDQLLDANDSFIATRWGIKLLAEDPAAPGTGILQAYPNNTVFVAVAGEVVPLHLNAFFNGRLRFKKDDTVQIEAWPTNLALTVPQTQQSASTNYSQAQGDDGVVLLPTTIGFNGSAKNEITLDIPLNPTTQKVQHVTAATRLYVVFVAYGFLLTGVSRLNNNG